MSDLVDWLIMLGLLTLGIHLLKYGRELEFAVNVFINGAIF